MPQFDPALIVTILAVGGIGVAGLTEMIKRFLKAQGIFAYVISGVVSVGATAFVLFQGEIFSVLNLIIYAVIVFLEANGIYKFTAKKI
jgi:hypothetical protein